MRGFPNGPSVKELICQCRRHKRLQSLGRKDPLEEGVATHSGKSYLENPWTAEPGGLQSRGSQRVRNH